MTISRRAFLKTAGAAMAGLAPGLLPVQIDEQLREIDIGEPCEILVEDVSAKRPASIWAPPGMAWEIVDAETGKQIDLDNERLFLHNYQEPIDVV